MDVICLGQQNWDYCWTGKQHYMTRLARRGHRVLYVDPESVEDVTGPADSLRAIAAARTQFGVRTLAPGLSVYTHRHAPALRWRVNHWRRPRLVAAIAERLGLHDPVVIAMYPTTERDLIHLTPRALLYFAVDEATGFGGMTEAERRRVAEAERRLLRRADVALGVSPRLQRKFAALHPRSYVLENGADLEHFAPERLAAATPHPRVARLPGPRLGFVGQVDERLDQQLLVELARERPEWQLVLAGRVKPGVDVTALAHEPNIHLLGYQPFEALPAVLREIDVCLVPYRLTELTHSCSPLKVYEYLATGRPVVSTPLEAITGYGHVVSLADSIDGFRRAIEAALADPAAGRETRLAFASANGWDERVDQLEQRMAEAIAVRGAWRPRLRAPTGRPSERRASEPELVDEPGARSGLSPYGRLGFHLFNAAGRLYHAMRVGARTLRGDRDVRIQKILVARQCRLGDLVTVLPMLRALRRLYPRAHVVFGVQPGFSSAALLAHSGLVDEIRELDHFSRPSRALRLAGATKLFAEGFDLVISGGRFFVMLEALMSGAPHRIGLEDGMPLQQLNTRVLRLDPTRHEADNNLALVEALGATIGDTERVPILATAPEQRESGRRLLRALGVPAEATVLAVHPGAQKPSRRWPPDRLAEALARLLAARPNLYVAFTGIPDESSLVDGVRAALPPELAGRAVSTIGRTDLPLLLGLLDSCDALLCNDTGIMHVARAQGVPLVAVLGPENHRRWGPYALGPASAIALRHVVPCAPCTRWNCLPHYCLRSLSVDAVVGAVSEILDAPRERDGRLEPLRLILQRRSWRSLAEQFELRRVVVRLHVRPEHAGSGMTERIERTMQSLVWQSYQWMSVAVVVHPGVPDPEVALRTARAAAGELRVVEDGSSGGAEPESAADVVEIEAGTSWSRWHLADYVASRVRVPVPATESRGSSDVVGVPLRLQHAETAPPPT